MRARVDRIIGDHWLSWYLVGGLLIVALVLRIYGVRHGLPFVYNADENAHFVPRAIGMFGHTYNPNYFINPPAYTYLLHVAFFVGFGGREGVSNSFAADPTAVFTIARVVSGVLGTLAVFFLYKAGRTLAGDRRTGLLAAGLLTVSFLVVHYSHFALNDVPTLAPLCLALWGAARIYRRGAPLDYAIAGVGLGLACATKYTAGIVVFVIIAAALVHERGPGEPVWRPFALLAAAGGVSLVAFVVANPYALLDWSSFTAGLTKQAEASSDGGGKLGLTEPNGIAYYLKTLGWGFGLLPALAALVGAAALVANRWREAVMLIPAPIVFLLFMGTQDRFFARWLLPVYPILCLLAAIGGVTLAREAVRAVERRIGGGRIVVDVSGARERRTAIALVAVAALLGAQGFVYSAHNDLVLAKKDTRQLVRDWMVQNIPEGENVVVEPVFPDQWAHDPGRPSPETRNGNRWNKWSTSRTTLNNDGKRLPGGRSRTVKLEDYERTTRPGLVHVYEASGFCWVVTGSTQYGRAYAEPEEVPNALRYYAELKRRGKVVYRVSPMRDGGAPPAFSFDFSFNAYPLGYDRPGPEIVVYRLNNLQCDDSLTQDVESASGG